MLSFGVVCGFICIKYNITMADHELWESLYSYILIKLSPYQYLCCIMSLISPFCSIKSPIFAVLFFLLKKSRDIRDDGLSQWKT